MRRCAFLVLLFVLLPGCQGGLTSTMPELTPQQRVYAIRGELNIALREAVAYAALPQCAPDVFVACPQPAMVDAIAVAGREAHKALTQAEEVVRAAEIDPTIDADSALPYIRAARAALGQIGDLLTPKQEA